MSLARRLRRIVRAQLGALRGSPIDEATESSYDDPIGGGPEPSGAAASSTEKAPDMPPDVAEAYRALEVPVDSDRKTVKTAYRRLMKRYHQDRFQQDNERRETAGEVSKQLNVAYDRILKYLDKEER
ncbi:MAG: hypothetical protein BRD55_00415 [Bacteroidetes bacterium SW_9_63_38]|nr:MAG: hypothetical protein BRD55_00415 [Bacteroidetes bacterium SW_9_63_38]